MKSAQERFWPKVQKTETCWIWTGATDPAGYGRFWLDGYGDYAHRVSMKLSGLEIPDRAVVMHSCDNRRCVNPGHLSAGSYRDNTADAVIKGRHPHGEIHGRSKLTAPDVLAIRAGSLSQSEASRLYGVSPNTIKKIRQRTIWRFL